LRQFTVQAPSQAPAHRPARIRVQNHRQENKLPPQANVGDVGHPELIHGRDLHAPRQIQIHLKVVLGIGGLHHILPLADGDQVVLLHQPSHTLTIDQHTAMAQLGGDAAVAIVPPVLEVNPLDGVAQFHLFFIRFDFHPMPVEPRSADAR